MCVDFFFFFFKQKTAYEMRISDWSSDVCSSDLGIQPAALAEQHRLGLADKQAGIDRARHPRFIGAQLDGFTGMNPVERLASVLFGIGREFRRIDIDEIHHHRPREVLRQILRSEEHTSELQSLMRISYAVFCLKKK